MQTKLIIGIPTINRADLLNEALIKYFEDFIETEIVIVDNGNQDIVIRENKFFIYRPHQNLGVSGSWNIIMDYADKVNATHVLMLNDDIYLGKTEEQILRMIDLFQHIHFLNSFMNWSSWILSVEAYKKIGNFDENFFPAYFEDNDYCYRMRLNEFERYNTDYLNPVVYRNSQTILKDSSLNQNFNKNRQYYASKWGGLPSEETFTTPFNK
jgi:GT2 family glycosyltransferase